MQVGKVRRLDTSAQVELVPVTSSNAVVGSVVFVPNCNRRSRYKYDRSVPLLQKRGLALIELPAGNFELAAHKGLLIKDSYWR